MAEGVLEWVGKRIELPVEVASLGDRRPELVLWVELPGLSVVGQTMEDPKARDTSFAQSLVRAMASPLVGPPRPDWVAEVLSPSTQRIDRGLKLGIYRRERVGHVWLVDPAARTLEIFRLAGDAYLWVATHENDAVIRAEPFDAIERQLGLLWQT